MLYKYPISRKKTKRADKINPIPKLNRIRQPIGNISIKKWSPKAILSKKTKAKKIANVNPKLIRVDTFFENKNRYFGTLILLNIDALLINEFIPAVVDSLKYENNKLPQKRYIV